MPTSKKPELESRNPLPTSAASRFANLAFPLSTCPVNGGERPTERAGETAHVVHLGFTRMIRNRSRRSTKTSRNEMGVAFKAFDISRCELARSKTIWAQLGKGRI